MGRDRKPANVLEASGAFAKNPNRRRDYGVENTGGIPVKPKSLSREASEIFDNCVRLMPWLIEIDSYPLAQYAHLTAQWQESPSTFPNAKLSSIRALEKQLGVTLIDRTERPKPRGEGDDLFDT